MPVAGDPADEWALGRVGLAGVWRQVCIARQHRPDGFGSGQDGYLMLRAGRATPAVGVTHLP